jgi:hypothetical protein
MLRKCNRALVVFSSFLFIAGLASGDVNAAFGISQDVPNGGCQQGQVDQVGAAFTEVVQMVATLQTAISSLQSGTETPAVGWVFSALFGIQATEELQDTGIARPQAQADALTIMNSKSSSRAKESY